jgi:hypothetical protein
MTKRNFFGELIHTPEDSPDDFAAYLDGLGGAYAANISRDASYGWCADVDMNEADIVAVYGFKDAASLRAWLVQAGIPEREIIEAES